MPKTQEELTQLKTEYETLNNKLKELSEDELKMVTGGLPDWQLPEPRRDNRNMKTRKYRCKDCGYEYIGNTPKGDALYPGDDFNCCPKCGSINREILGYF